MRFDDGRTSSNVEDRRGMRAGFGGFGGFGGGMGRGIGGLGVGGLLVLLVLGYLTTGNPLGLLSGGEAVDESGYTAQPADPNYASDPGAKFVSEVLKDTEETWDQLFAAANRSYSYPKLVLFSDQVNSACGFTSAAVGPFYCPGDRKVYIDLSFYRDLDQRFGAPGDFAQAYVIAHEVGHHVQNLVGVFDRAEQLRSSGANANAVSVRQELQADCLAGVWGHYAAQRGRLETGDLEEGLNAAAAIGDDRIQRSTRGQVNPESFTHGSSADRVQAFKQGFDAGQMTACGINSR
ncbi:MAG TPA: neutral zinc metallopeptidase [Vicinamibacterales bacterium]|nr:neutral zinc metallopeptidase [Vicinamibacterales bacterium]